MFTLYSIKERRYISFEDWEQYQASLNENIRFAKTLHFSDFKNHSEYLPSYHPYWIFRSYLRLKALLITKYRSIAIYKNTLSDDLNTELAERIKGVILSEERNIQELLKTYRKYQSEFVNGINND